jgi:hypothetical protein
MNFNYFQWEFSRILLENYMEGFLSKVKREVSGHGRLY